MRDLKSTPPASAEAVKSAPILLSAELLTQIAGGVVTPPDAITSVTPPSDPTW